jgi:hypothetical protein
MRRASDERGVSLILVLVTLVVFGLIVPVLGQFGSTNGVSGYVLKGQRFDRYAAEAGMQGAIEWAQTQSQRQAGRQGSHCPDLSTGDITNGGGANATRSVTIDCAGFNGHGLPAATDSIPQYALQARGGDSDAIRVEGTGSVRTSGAWWSEGGIRIQGPTIDATADYVGAKRSCGGIGPDDASPLDCSSSRTSDTVNLSVPADPPVDVDLPSPDPCVAVRDGNGTVRLAPGLHWDENFFDRIGDGRCDGFPNVTIVLAGGGPHIFDFTFYRRGTNADSDSNVWKINPSQRRVHVVVKSEESNNGTCASPSTSPVLFARSFQMEVDANARVELCGATAGTQQVSIAQVEGGTNPTIIDGPTTTPTRWTVDDRRGRLDGMVQSPPSAAGLLANADCTPDRGGCAGGSIQGRLHGDHADGIVRMTVPDPTPPRIGAKMERLHLAITHLEDNPGDVDERHVWIDGLPDQFDCNLTNPNFGLDAGNGWHTNEYDCRLNDDDSEQRPYFPAGNLTVNYEVQLQDRRNGDNPPERESNIGLDAVTVRAVYAEPTTRTSLDNQTILKLAGGGTLRTDGTVYLPTGDMTAELQNAPDTKFARGLVVKTIDIQSVPAQADFTPFSLPNGGDYTDRIATFRAFLGGDKSKTSLLTARVLFCDAHLDGAPLFAPPDDCTDVAGGPAKILAWDPQR